jgi:hypothetical protein
MIQVCEVSNQFKRVLETHSLCAGDHAEVFRKRDCFVIRD